MRIHEGIRVILASASPRRYELLTQIDICRFEVIPAKGEEVITTGVPEEAVMELAGQKAAEVFASTEGPRLVIGADTVVALDKEILGKPADREDAFNMICAMRGRTNHVYTGVSLMWDDEAASIAGTGQGAGEDTFFSVTGVTFFPMTDREVRDYVDTGEADDKAGAYGAQGIFGRHVERIEGEFANVVGLPVASLYKHLAEKGFFI